MKQYDLGVSVVFNESLTFEAFNAVLDFCDREPRIGDDIPDGEPVESESVSMLACPQVRQKSGVGEGELFFSRLATGDMESIPGDTSIRPS